MSNNSKPWHRRPRTALAACAVASLVAGLTACGGGDGDEQSSLGKDDTLTITTFSEFGYDDQIKKWNADPDRPFKIKQTKIAEWDTWKESMTKALQAGTELPDVIAVEGDAMAALLADGANEQFADISDPELDDRWVEYAYKAGQTTDGKQIGYPTDIGPEAMCYRADLFEKAGLPSDPAGAAALFKDWDTYYKTGEQFTKKLPKTKWYDASGSVAQAMLNQVEFPFQTEDQKVDVDNDELKAVYDTVTKYSPTLSTKVVQWGEDWQANFTNDGFATMPCPGWMFANIKSSAPDVKGWRIADAFPGGGGNWGGSFLAVPASGEHTKEAQEVANYLTNAESQVSASKAAGNFPGNLEAQKTLQSENAEDPYFGNAKTTEILTNRAAAVTPGVPFKGDKYSDVLGLFQTAIQRVDEGEDPEKSWTTFVGAVGNL
ncbi:ABC transporter substrate-binding protein [Nocardioides sp. NPDC126508]